MAGVLVEEAIELNPSYCSAGEQVHESSQRGISEVPLHSGVCGPVAGDYPNVQIDRAAGYEIAGAVGMGAKIFDDVLKPHAQLVMVIRRGLDVDRANPLYKHGRGPLNYFWNRTVLMPLSVFSAAQGVLVPRVDHAAVLAVIPAAF